MGPRSIPGIFVSYEPNGEASGCWLMADLRISGVVIFLENKRGLPGGFEVDSRSHIIQDAVFNEEEDEVSEFGQDEFMEMFVEPGDDYPKLPSESWHS